LEKSHTPDRQYVLIKWKGLPYSKATWEPRDEFLEQHPAAGLAGALAVYRDRQRCASPRANGCRVRLGPELTRLPDFPTVALGVCRTAQERWRDRRAVALDAEFEAITTATEHFDAAAMRPYQVRRRQDRAAAWREGN